METEGEIRVTQPQTGTPGTKELEEARKGSALELIP